MAQQHGCPQGRRKEVPPLQIDTSDRRSQMCTRPMSCRVLEVQKNLASLRRKTKERSVHEDSTSRQKQVQALRILAWSTDQARSTSTNNARKVGGSCIGSERRSRADVNTCKCRHSRRNDLCGAGRTSRWQRRYRNNRRSEVCVRKGAGCVQQEGCTDSSCNARQNGGSACISKCLRQKSRTPARSYGTTETVTRNRNSADGRAPSLRFITAPRCVYGKTPTRCPRSGDKHK